MSARTKAKRRASRLRFVERVAMWPGRCGRRRTLCRECKGPLGYCVYPCPYAPQPWRWASVTGAGCGGRAAGGGCREGLRDVSMVRARSGRLALRAADVRGVGGWTMNGFDDEIAAAEDQWARAETLEEIWHARARLEAAYGPEDDWVRACCAQGVDPAGIPVDPPEG